MRAHVLARERRRVQVPPGKFRSSDLDLLKGGAGSCWGGKCSPHSSKRTQGICTSNWSGLSPIATSAKEVMSLVFYQHDAKSTDPICSLVEQRDTDQERTLLILVVDLVKGPVPGFIYFNVSVGKIMYGSRNKTLKYCRRFSRTFVLVMPSCGPSLVGFQDTVTKH